jgi:hypothetical protein
MILLTLFWAILRDYLPPCESFLYYEDGDDADDFRPGDLPKVATELAPAELKRLLKHQFIAEIVARAVAALQSK